MGIFVSTEYVAGMNIVTDLNLPLPQYLSGSKIQFTQTHLLIINKEIIMPISYIPRISVYKNAPLKITPFTSLRNYSAVPETSPPATIKAEKVTQPIEIEPLPVMKLILPELKFSYEPWYYVQVYKEESARYAELNVTAEKIDSDRQRKREKEIAFVKKENAREDEIRKEEEKRSKEIAPKEKKVDPRRQASKEAKRLKQEAALTEAKEISLKEDKLLDFKLPLDSALNIKGHKTIQMKYGDAFYLDSDREDSPNSSLTSGIDIYQELQVKLTGTIKNQLSINMDYSDIEGQEKEDFSVVYTAAKENERAVIQDVSFGDVSLNIGDTEFVSYSKQTFGAKANILVEKVKFMGIASRTKGISETKEFTGTQYTTQKDTNDTSYQQRKYYQLLAEYDTRPLPVSNLEVWLDDKSEETQLKATITTKSFDGMGTYTHPFQKLYPGIDYILDANTGVVTFKRFIAADYVIAVSFIDVNGDRHPINQPDSYLTIKPEQSESGEPLMEGEYDLFELKNYYSLNAPNLVVDDPSFILDIREKASGKNYYDQNQNNLKDADEYTFVRIFALDQILIDDKIDIEYLDKEFGYIIFPTSHPFDLIANRSIYRGRPYGDILDQLGTYTLETLSNPSIYDYSSSPKSIYYLHMEYKTKVQSYSLRFDILENSERVYVNGKLMRKDIDYWIDYETGFLGFYPSANITETSNIKITYEYMPFGGQYQENLFGLRTTFDPNKQFHLGSTYLYEGSMAPAKVPKITSTNDTLQVVDVDGKVELVPFLMDTLSLFRIEPDAPPLSVTLSGEIANSFNNVNPYGKAMIDSMEGIGSIRDASINEDSWSISGLPSEVIGRAKLYPDKPEKQCGPYNRKEDFMTDDKNEDEETLVLQYEGLDSQSSFSICQSLSKTAMDYSEYTHLEVWVKNNPSFQSADELYVDVGIVSEDTDEDGNLDKEDKNDDGNLNVGEDVGWEFNDKLREGPGTYTKVGADNEYLDSEDLDGDGYLDTQEGYFAIPVKKEGIQSIPQSAKGDWVVYTISLDNLGTKTKKGNQEASWTLIKHLRIRIAGTNTSNTTGEIVIGAVSFIGNRWEKGTVTGGGSLVVTSKNTKDDRDYIDEKLEDNKAFKDLHGDEKIENEETLVLNYLLSPQATGTTYQKFYTPQNYGNYKSLRFFINYKPTKGRLKFVFQFGPSSESYFAYAHPLSQIGWELVEIDLEHIKKIMCEQLNVVGVPPFNYDQDGYVIKGSNPALYNIQYIWLKLINEEYADAEGEVWVNEIHLSDTIVKKGEAYKWGVTSKYKEWLIMEYNQNEKDADFKSVGGTEAPKDVKTTNIKVDYIQIKALPLNFNQSYTRTITDPAKAEDVFNVDIGQDETTTNEITATLKLNEVYIGKYALSKLPDIVPGTFTPPDIIAKYTDTDKEIFRESNVSTTQDEGYSGNTSLTYTCPQKLFWLIPTGYTLALTPSYEYAFSDGKLGTATYPDKPKNFADTRKESYKESIAIDSYPIEHLNLYGEFSQSKFTTNYLYETSTSTEVTGSRKENGTIKLNLYPLELFGTKTDTYTKLELGQSEEKRKDYDEFLLISRNAHLTFNKISLLPLTRLPGITHCIDSKFDYTENYTTLSNFDQSLDVKTGSNFTLNFPITPVTWWQPLKFVTLTPSYKLDISANYSFGTESRTSGDIINAIYRDYYQGRLFHISPYTDELFLKRDSAQVTHSYSVGSTWSIWQPYLSTTTGNWSLTNKESQTGSSISYEISRGVSSKTTLNMTRAFPATRGLCGTSSLIVNYSRTETEIPDKSISITQTPSFILNSIYSKALSTTTNVGLSHTETEEGRLKKLNYTVTPSISMIYNIDKPGAFKIPFIKRKITLTHTLKTTASLTTKFERGYENELPKTEKDTYTLKTDGTYKMTDNTVWTLGISAEYFRNGLEIDQDYISYEGLTKVVLTF